MSGRKAGFIGFRLPEDEKRRIEDERARLGIGISEFMRLAVSAYFGAAEEEAEQGKMALLTVVPDWCIGRKSNSDYKCPRRADPRGDQCGPCWHSDADIREAEDKERERRKAAGTTKLY